MDNIRADIVLYKVVCILINSSDKFVPVVLGVKILRLTSCFIRARQILEELRCFLIVLRAQVSLRTVLCRQAAVATIPSTVGAEVLALIDAEFLAAVRGSEGITHRLV